MNKDVSSINMPALAAGVATALRECEGSNFQTDTLGNFVQEIGSFTSTMRHEYPTAKLSDYLDPFLFRPVDHQMSNCYIWHIRASERKGELYAVLYYIDNKQDVFIPYINIFNDGTPNVLIPSNLPFDHMMKIMSDGVRLSDQYMPLLTAAQITQAVNDYEQHFTASPDPSE